MNQLLPIIRRVRRPLLPPDEPRAVIEPAEPVPVVTDSKPVLQPTKKANGASRSKTASR